MQLALGQFAAAGPRQIAVFLELGHLGGQQLLLCRQFLEHGVRVQNLELDLVALARKQLEPALGLFAVQVALEAFLIEPRAGAVQVLQAFFELGQVALFGGEQVLQLAEAAFRRPPGSRSPSSMLDCKSCCAASSRAMFLPCRFPFGFESCQPAAGLIEIGLRVGLLAERRVRGRALCFPEPTAVRRAECGAQIEVELQLLFLLDEVFRSSAAVRSHGVFALPQSAGRAAPGRF